ncbi:MFS general substrate transporter [Sistotremastrum suecicum HHB10207 ss-3]|uniref:MFS general substrate transporter n=1 Tax=Sistotremastrum suecicum HHB10207 ss-3 TaxID=1314776 RepID=A0A165YJE2_9AGAM|nr:MFS general substrate transporter [Sistotremastrum suecicum HHB10207 ss-3]
MFISSSLLYIVCNFMLSIAKHHEYYQIFLSQGLGMGIAMGAMYASTIGILIRHFRTYHRALAIGIASTGAAIGGVIYPIMLNNSIHRGDALVSGGTVDTFPGAIRQNAVLNTGMLVLANLLIRVRYSQADRGNFRSRFADMMRFLKEPTYVFTCIGSSLTNFGYLFPVVYIQLFSAKQGISPKFSFYTLSIFNACSIIGRIIPNILADRFGSLTVLVPMNIAMGATVLGYLGVNSLVADAIVTALIGVFSGACVSLFLAAASSSSKQQGEIGARTGLVVFFSSIPSLAGPPINGALLTNRFLWSRPIIFSGISTIGGGFSYLLALMFQARNRRLGGDIGTVAASASSIGSHSSSLSISSSEKK